MTRQLTLSLSPPVSLFHSIQMQFWVCVYSQTLTCMELFREASGWTVRLVQAATSPGQSQIQPLVQFQYNFSSLLWKQENMYVLLMIQVPGFPSPLIDLTFQTAKGAYIPCVGPQA